MSDNKYQNGKIYTIRNKNDDTLIYVGSTVQQLHKRFYEHKIHAYNEKSKEYNKLLYQKIRETNNINDWYIELYEDFPTDRKEQLNKREGEIIREIGTLNKLIAGRTPKEWRENNKNKINEWREKTKEKLKEQRKDNYEVNKKNKKNKKDIIIKLKKKTKKNKKDIYRERERARKRESERERASERER